MTREEALKLLKEADSYDPERAHQEADDVLCELLKSLGYEDVVKAWDEVSKWYS